MEDLDVSRIFLSVLQKTLSTHQEAYGYAFNYKDIQPFMRNLLTINHDEECRFLSKCDRSFIDEIRKIFVKKISNYHPINFPNNLFFYMTRRKASNPPYYANVTEADITQFMKNYQQASLAYFDISFGYRGKEAVVVAYRSCLNILNHAASPLQVYSVWKGSFQLGLFLTMCEGDESLAIELAIETAKRGFLSFGEVKNTLKTLEETYSKEEYKHFEEWIDYFGSLTYGIKEEEFERMKNTYEKSITEYITYVVNNEDKIALQKFGELERLKATLLKNEHYLTLREKIKEPL